MGIGRHVPGQVRTVARAVAERPALVFGLFLVVSFVALLRVGDYFWFFRDDWLFITDRELDLESLFRPHNAHWSVVPVAIFRALYAVFGVRTYLPYQMVVVGMHLGIVALLRLIMVRAGVGPWLAGAVAGSFVFFGPGREDILWAFQIGFTGSILFGLGQLLLADHDGPPDRRDAFALVSGLLGLMSSSPSTVLVGVVGLALLVRRGWRAALLHTVPLGLAWGLYNVFAEPETSPVDRPPFGVVVDWLENAMAANFLGIGHYRPVVAGLVVVLVVGVVAHLLGSDDRWERVRELALPAALFVGCLAFIVLVTQGRWYQGPQGARARRYVYFYSMATLPLLGLAMAALVRRWRVLLPVVGLVLVAVPANYDGFYDPPFGPHYHASRRDLLTAVVALPEAREVDGDLRPIPDVFMGEGVTLDYLLHAERTGKLTAADLPLPPALRDELLVRLTLAQEPGPAAEGCELVLVDELQVEVDEGDVIGIGAAVRVQLVRDGQPVGPRVQYAPIDGGHLVAARSGVELLVTPDGNTAEVLLCNELDP